MMLDFHNDYAGSQTGFGVKLITSNTAAEGEVEIIGINRNQSTVATWRAGVIQSTDTPSNSKYYIHHNFPNLLVSIPSTGTTGNITNNGISAVEEITVSIDDI